MLIAEQKSSDRLSDGHLFFYAGREFFAHNNAIYAAPAAMPVMPDGHRCGRFECGSHGLADLKLMYGIMD